MLAKVSINLAFLIAGYFIKKWTERQLKRVQSNVPAFVLTREEARERAWVCAA